MSYEQQVERLKAKCQQLQAEMREMLSELDEAKRKLEREDSSPDLISRANAIAIQEVRRLCEGSIRHHRNAISGGMTVGMAKVSLGDAKQIMQAISRAEDAALDMAEQEAHDEL